jgi:hypothetical protein
MKNQEDAKMNCGFIAQDIEALVGTTNAVLTIGGDKDRYLGLRYTDFIAPIVKAMQEQQAMVEAVQKENKMLAASNSALETKLSVLQKEMIELKI